MDNVLNKINLKTVKIYSNRKLKYTLKFVYLKSNNGNKRMYGGFRQWILKA